jgi:hypothetical protein
MPPSDPNLAGVVSSVEAVLRAADEALMAGRTYLAIGSLAQAMDLLGGMRANVDLAETVKGGLPAFEAEWSKASVGLAATGREVRAHNWSGSPAALRAMWETALGKSGPLMEGSRGFAVATGPKDGLFYLGQARGGADFVRFCESLRLTRKTRAWPARSMLPELLALQEQADAAFQPPQSIEQHPRFIALNSAIKLARELDSTKAYYGSLYQYLESVRQFGMLDAPPVDAPRRDALQARIEAERKRLADSSHDDSIAQIFLERAAVQTAHADGSEPTADEWRSAQLIVNRVLPAYDAALKPATTLQRTKGKTIDVTLVRWPYT